MTTESPIASSERPSRKTESAWRTLLNSPAHLAVLVGLILLTGILRLGSAFDFPNFAMLLALSVFCGIHVKHRAAMLIPLVVRLITDCIIEYRTGFGFWESWYFDYSCYVLIFLVSLWIPAKGRGRIVGATATGLGAIVVYFLVSNGGVWFLGSPATYDRSFAGLMNCYAMGLPFVKGTVWGNVIGLPLFLLAWSLVPAPAPQSEPQLEQA